MLVVNVTFWVWKLHVYEVGHKIDSRHGAAMSALMQVSMLRGSVIQVVAKKIQ